MRLMEGKTTVITGPTSGIGKEIAKGLAALGSTLVLGCRDTAAGTALAQELHLASKSSVDVVHVDVSSRQSVQVFAQNVLERHKKLHVVVNNAAVSRGPQPLFKSPDGIELTFATNVLGYFFILQALLPRLQESAPARIINVASTFASDLDLEDLQFQHRPYDGMKAYAQSKACDRMLTWALARRLDGSGVTANAMAPGLIVDTGLYRHAPPEVVAQLRKRGGGRTPSDGADTAIWLSSSPDIQEVTGKFFENRDEIPCSFRNRENEERLWTICETLSR